MRITNNFVFFWGSIFSQWDKTFTEGRNYQFEKNGIKYTSAEQFMMYHKALLFEDVDIANKILQTSNVKIIKNLGRQVKNFDKIIWDNHFFNIIVEGNLLKFSQNKNLFNELMKLSEKEFVEASPVDTIYGIGLHWNDNAVLDKKNWRGSNYLGKAISTVVSLLKDD